jgi:hypothetical protein
MIHLFTPAAALAAALLLAACGGGGDPAPAGGASASVTLDSARTARATIGPAGGSVSATAADGRRYTLTVPAGALAADTAISATPVTSMGNAPLAAGTRAAVRFGPAGLKFAIPATLRIEGLAATVAAGKRRVGFVRSDDGTRMQRVPAGTVSGALELPVPHFSDVGVADATTAELALVPLTSPESVTEEIWREVDRRLDQLPCCDITTNDIAAVLTAVIDGIVTPLQTAAATSTEAAVRESGVSAFADVARVIELGVPSESVPQLLALMNGRVERVRAAAGALLKADFEAGLSDCAAPGPADLIHKRGLNAAASVTALLPSYDLSPGRIGLGLQAPTLVPALGLDVQTLRRRLNDCARVVFVPQTLPTFETGRPVSLDQKAALVFAIDATDEVQAGFDFIVQGTDGDVANPSGFSDFNGLYTTVVTPRGTQPQFSTRACFVATLRSGAQVASELCGTQQVSGGGVILAGSFSLVLLSSEGAIGDLTLRLRFDPTSGFTVLAASGGIRRLLVTTAECRPTPADGRPPVTRNLSSDFREQYTGGRMHSGLLAGLQAIELIGSATRSNESFRADCSVQTATSSQPDGSVVGVLFIRSIDRDAQGVPTAVSFSYGSSSGPVSGRVVRQ